MEIKGYISTLDKNTGDVLQLLKECSEEQFEHKDGEAWSILEILEHLLIIDRAVHRILLKRDRQQAETPELAGSEKIKRFMSHREYKIASPEAAKPKGEIKNESQFVQAFLKQRGLLIDDLEKGNIVLDNGIVAHAVIGDMTKRDWLSFLVSHAERHLEQIKEVLEKF